MSTFDFVWYEYVRKIRWISFLDYFSYEKAVALEILQRDCDYKPYPYKHYEISFHAVLPGIYPSQEIRLRQYAAAISRRWSSPAR